MKINVVAVRNKSKFSIIKYLIYIFQGMIFRKDRYNHFAIELIDEELTDYTACLSYMDATLKTGVAIKNKETFFKHYKIVRRWPDVGALGNLDVFLYHNLGKKYASEQLFGYLFEQLRIWKNNLLGSNDRRIVCSELIALWLKENHFEIQDSDEYDLITIEKLLNEHFDSYLVK